MGGADGGKGVGIGQGQGADDKPAHPGFEVGGGGLGVAHPAAELDRIEAEGRVTIIRKDLKATGEKATYDIKEAKMQLTGNPIIQRDQDKLTGQTITLWRNSKRILCEPDARLVIASEQDVGRSLKE